MSKKITIELMDGSENVLGKGAGLLINADGIGPDDASGMLLLAYQAVAKQFIDGHSMQCTNCPPYVLHLRVRGAMNKVMEQAKGQEVTIKNDKEEK